MIAVAEDNLNPLYRDVCMPLRLRARPPRPCTQTDLVPFRRRVQAGVFYAPIEGMPKTLLFPPLPSLRTQATLWCALGPSGWIYILLRLMLAADSPWAQARGGGSRKWYVTLHAAT